MYILKLSIYKLRLKIQNFSSEVKFFNVKF